MLKMEISRLIERCRRGDESALGELYKVYARRMRGVCRRYISDEEAINDVLHDAFVIIFTSFDKLRDDSKAESWMMAITRNVASKYKEHLNALPTIPLDETTDKELFIIDDEEQDVRGIPLQEVIRLIDKLPAGYGQVFRLSVFEGMTHKEIAAALGIEPHSSSSQLARAKKMLRKMMQQYWALLMLLIIPVAYYLLQKETPIKGGKTNVAKKDEKPIEQQQEPLITHSPTHQTPVTTIPIPRPVFVQTIDSVTFDTVSNLIVQTVEVPDSTSDKEPTDTTQSIIKVEIPHYDIAHLKLEKPKHYNMHLAIAYAGVPSSNLIRNANFMTMPSLSSTATRASKLYNWGDYINYVATNAPMMDSISAYNMQHIAIINSSHPLEPITETKHHERPLTLQLSLSRQLSNHWSFATGLSYTRMKSTFESGNENTLIHRTQRLHYLGIPIRLNYRMVGGNRWNIYTSGGIQLDIPVRSRLTTQYIYGGQYSAYNNSPEIITNIRVPWQWSVGAGLGVEYQIIPHLNLYLEPSLNYYIPTTSDIENYHTEHPLDLSLPIGIRISW